jgi:hypothetical protein
MVSSVVGRSEYTSVLMKSRNPSPPAPILDRVTGFEIGRLFVLPQPGVLTQFRTYCGEPTFCAALQAVSAQALKSFYLG